MTECLFQYDRLYLNAAYHEPDEHRHLMSHMIIGVSQRVRCSVNHYEFAALCVGLFWRREKKKGDKSALLWLKSIV